MKKYTLTLFVLSLLLSACGERDASLTSSWNLVSYGPAGSPVAAVEDSGAQITFNEDGTVAGNSGCNGFGGNYTVEGDQITFDQIVSTLIACEDPLMTQEQSIHQVVTDTAIYEIDGDTLTLTNNDLVLVLTQ
jgi:heat shock protein HslJ